MKSAKEVTLFIILLTCIETISQIQTGEFFLNIHWSKFYKISLFKVDFFKQIFKSESFQFNWPYERPLRYWQSCFIITKRCINILKMTHPQKFLRYLPIWKIFSIKHPFNLFKIHILLIKNHRISTTIYH